jgi:hypothetical protein
VLRVATGARGPAGSPPRACDGYAAVLSLEHPYLLPGPGAQELSPPPPLIFAHLVFLVA